MNGPYQTRLRIGELAAELGLNPRTIRYYEQIGLLSAPGRTPAGYRLYDDTHREYLRFIGKAKAVGLTLNEIREILTLRRRGEQPCGHVRKLLDEKVAAVDRQLQALTQLRQQLMALRDMATESPPRASGVCRIIEHCQPPVAGPRSAPLLPFTPP